MSFRARSALLAPGLIAVTLAPAPADAQGPAADISRYDRGIHIVRPGENLHQITENYLGNALLWRRNWSLNPEIADPDVLTPGQRIEVLVEQRQSVPTARLRSIAGRVEERPAPIDWNAALEEDLLLEEDGLRTGSNASTEMEFQDGTRMLMTEESVVYLRRRGRRLTGVSPRAVEIVEGQAEVSTQRPPGAESAIEILVGGTRAVSRPDESGVAQTRARRAADDSAKVMVYEGGGEVASGGQTVAVARGMGTSVEQGRPPAPPEKLLPAPEGRTPEPGARLGFNNFELSWQPVEGAASYTVELCRDADCALLVKRGLGLEQPAWWPPPLAAGDYFWRVTAVSGSGLDGYPSAGAALAVLGGADTTGPAGTLSVSGPQLRRGPRWVVDENVLLEPRLSDGQSGIAGWRPLIDGAEASLERWSGPWPDGEYRLSVVAVDRVGNESRLPEVELEVDASAPRLEVSGWSPSADRTGSARCGWLLTPASRWPRVTECRWLERAQRRWLSRGWSWLEVSADGRFWRPLVEHGSPLAAEVRAAGLELPLPAAAVAVRGDDPQLLLRSGGGGDLKLPDGATGSAPLLRIRAVDAGGGVESMELRVRVTESGTAVVEAAAEDVFGHRRELRWSAQP